MASLPTKIIIQEAALEAAIAGGSDITLDSVRALGFEPLADGGDSVLDATENDALALELAAAEVSLNRRDIIIAVFAWYTHP